MRRATLIWTASLCAITGSMVLIAGTLLPVATVPTTAILQPARGTFVDAGTCVEAPTVGFGAPGLAGRATLCDDGQKIRATVQIINLSPGEVYTAWLDYTTLRAGCRDGSCRQVDTQGDDPGSSMQRIGSASAKPSGVLELDRELPDVRLVHGAQITLQILGERGRAGPYAQAIFIVP